MKFVPVKEVWPVPVSHNEEGVTSLSISHSQGGVALVKSLQDVVLVLEFK